MTSIARRERPVQPVAAATAAVALLAVLTGCGDGATPRASTRVGTTPTATGTTPSPSSAPSRQAVPKGSTLVATATTAKVAVRLSPGGALHWSLANPNTIGAPLLFRVVGEDGAWWKVQVPARPNGAVGWVSATDVKIEIDPYRVIVSLSRHSLKVILGGRTIWHFPVGVGRPSAPTPTGAFYLTELLQAPNPHGAYGPYAYGTSAFSDTFSEFEGGPGQIGVHGTNDPSSIGRNVSHGCIRLRNSDMSTLAGVVPAGTPIAITL